MREPRTKASITVPNGVLFAKKGDESEVIYFDRHYQETKFAQLKRLDLATCRIKILRLDAAAETDSLPVSLSAPNCYFFALKIRERTIYNLRAR